jgi:nucleoside-diphosphate-sugar epimerase
MEAFDYAKRTGVDVVSVCPSLVIGPMLQLTVNASSSVVVDFLKGSVLRFLSSDNSYPYPTCM